MEKPKTPEEQQLYTTGFLDLPRELRDQVYHEIALDGVYCIVQKSQNSPFAICYMSNMDAFRMILEVMLESIPGNNQLTPGINYKSCVYPLIRSHDKSVSPWEKVHSQELLVNYNSSIDPQACVTYSEAFQLIADSQRVVATEDEIQNLRISQLTSFLKYCQNTFLGVSTLSFRGNIGRSSVYNPQTRYQKPTVPFSHRLSWSAQAPLDPVGTMEPFWEHQEFKACLRLVKYCPEEKVSTVRFSARFFSDQHDEGMEILRKLSSQCGRKGIKWAIFNEAENLQHDLKE